MGSRSGTTQRERRRRRTPPGAVTLDAVIDVLGALREGLAPHYTVEREIGAGGMARVYLAQERHPPRQVAVKVMNPELSTPMFRERFIREIEVTSKLSHPNIVPILAADECLFVPDGPDGLCYYVMPYVDGESLRVRLLREGTLPLHEALRITFQVADGLSYAHAHGVVHRDVKPENILLSGSAALIADFGIARAVSAAGVRTLTDVGQPVGSPAYMSPEQLAGSRTIDARTDVYSLACVLYELLVGQPPLLDVAEGSAPGRAALETSLRAQGANPRAARRIRETMSRALAAQPADRFPAVDQFAAALRGAVVRQPRKAGWIPRISVTASLLGGAAAVVLAGGVMVLVANRGRALDPRRVLVGGFENLTGDPTLASLSHIVAAWVTQELARSGRVEVVSAVAGGQADVAAIQALAIKTGAGTVVSGSYYTHGDSVRFQLQIIDVERETVRRVLEPVGAPLLAPADAADGVRRRVAAAVDSLFAPARN